MRRRAPLDGAGGRATSNTDLQIACRIVDKAGVVPVLAPLMDAEVGRHRTISVRALLVACQLNAMARHHRAHLVEVARIINALTDDQRAELGIAVQDKTQWSKGYGTDAIKLAMEYGFDDLELNRIELTVDEANARGRRCYEKCGFVEEGLLRQHRFVEGEFGNTVVMSVLKSEWEARR